MCDPNVGLDLTMGGVCHMHVTSYAVTIQLLTNLFVDQS